MNFLLAFIGGWLLLLAYICARVLRMRRETRQVSQQWRHDEAYHRDGDLPPGTRR